MTNRFYKAKDLFAAGSLIYFDLNGNNTRDYISKKIKFKGKFSKINKNMIQRNYENISQNLEVYPTVTVYSSNHKFSSGIGGLYLSEKNHINILFNDLIISSLAHEMRHAFQYIYYPDFFFASEYKNLVDYLNCPTERDARTYAMDYCQAKQYWSELSQLEDNERQYKLVISKTISPKSVGLNNSYFKRNRSIGVTVSRDYHINGDNYSSQYSPSIFKRIWHKIVNLTQFMISTAVILSIIFLIIDFEEEDKLVESEELIVEEISAYEYVIDESSLNEFINNYRYNYEIALVHEDFSYVKDMLQEDSNIYNEVEQYIDQISGQGMVFDFTNLIVEHVEISSDYAVIHTYEAFDFKNTAGEWSEEERTKKYKVVISEDGYYEIVEITNK